MDGEAAASIIEAGAQKTTVKNRVSSVSHRGVEVPIGTDAAGAIVVLDEIATFVESRGDAPSRRQAAVQVDDLDSLIAYVNRQKLEGQTACFARKAPTPTVIVMVDWHRPQAAAPGWAMDRVTYQPKLSRQWLAWMALAKEPVGQDAFADYLEDNLDDVLEREGFPLKLELVKMARDLHVTIGQKYQRTIDPQSGDATLVATTDSNQSKTRIPRELLLGIPVFDGSTVQYAIRVGLRLELRGDKAYFVLKPRNADVALEDAFNDIRKAVAEKCSIPVFAGVP